MTNGSRLKLLPNLLTPLWESVPDVTAIAANSQEVWVGTRSDGAIHYSQLTGDIQNYSPVEGFPAWVKDIQMDETEIWFATDTGIIRKIRGGVDPPLLYNTQTSFITSDDIETLLLTPQTDLGSLSRGKHRHVRSRKRGMGFLSLYRDSGRHADCWT